CPAWVWEPEQWSCAALVGSKAQGESCTNHGDLQPLVISECKEGLVCNAGRCIAEYPVPSAAQEGDDCGRGDVPGCGKGLYCGEDGLCAVRGGAGSACTSYVGCETNLFCEGMANGTGTCSAKKAPGSSCDPRDWASCDSPNWPDETYECEPSSNTCQASQPGLCRLTHPVYGG